MYIYAQCDANMSLHNNQPIYYNEFLPPNILKRFQNTF